MFKGGGVLMDMRCCIWVDAEDTINKQQSTNNGDFFG